MNHKLNLVKHDSGMHEQGVLHGRQGRRCMWSCFRAGGWMRFSFQPPISLADRKLQSGPGTLKKSYQFTMDQVAERGWDPREEPLWLPRRDQRWSQRWNHDSILQHFLPSVAWPHVFPDNSKPTTTPHPKEHIDASPGTSHGWGWHCWAVTQVTSPNPSAAVERSCHHVPGPGREGLSRSMFLNGNK